MVTELSKKVKFTEEQSFDMAGYFPTLLWIIRDFHLELLDEYGMSISNDDYLEDALKEQSGFSGEIMERNKIRTLIKTYFADRHCFTMVRPAHEERDLQELAAGTGKTREQFEKQIGEVRELIFSTIKAKSINGVPMTGRTFLGFAQKIVSALNEGAVPFLPYEKQIARSRPSRMHGTT